MGGAEDRRRQVTADVRLLGALAGPLAQVLPRHLIDDLRAPDRPADPYPVRVVVATLAHGLDPVAPVDRLTGWAGRPVRPGSCPVRLVPVSAGPATVTLTPQQHHWATNQAHTVAAALAGLRPRSGPAWSPPPDRPDLDATVRWLTTRPLVPVAGRADGPHVAGLIGRLDDLVELAGLVRVVVGGAPTPRTPLTVRTPLTGVPVDAAADGPPLTVLDVSATIPGPGRSSVDVGALLRDAHVAVIAVELPVLDSPDAGRVGALLHQALAALPPSQVTVLVSTDPLPQGPDRPWIGPYAASRLGVDATWATTGVHQVGTAMGPATKRVLDAAIGLDRDLIAALAERRLGNGAAAIGAHAAAIDRELTDRIGGPDPDPRRMFDPGYAVDLWRGLAMAAAAPLAASVARGVRDRTQRPPGAVPPGASDPG